MVVVAVLADHGFSVLHFGHMIHREKVQDSVLWKEKDRAAGRYARECLRETLAALGVEAASDVTILVSCVSIRQDLKQNVLNLIEECDPFSYGKLIHNGSIFTSVDDTVACLRKLFFNQPRYQIEPMKLLTADLFYDRWGGQQFQPGAYLEKESHIAQDEQSRAVLEQYASFASQNVNKAPHNGRHPDLLCCQLPDHTVTDQSKFLMIWINAQALSLRYPEEVQIPLLYFDDSREYGEGLLAFFEDHPDLLPTNTTLVCYIFLMKTILVESYDASENRKLGSVGGAGETYADYAVRAKQFALQAAGENLNFNGIERIKAKPSLLDGLLRQPEVQVPVNSQPARPLLPWLFMGDIPWCQFFREKDKKCCGSNPFGKVQVKSDSPPHPVPLPN